MKKQSGNIAILSEFFQPRDVALELWIWMADGNSSNPVLIIICLPKRVWRFSQAPGCQIEFLWDYGSACWSILDQSFCLLQVYAPNATSEYQAFADEVNDALLRVSLLNLQILLHMLEQTQAHGRAWLENIESLDWMRTKGIYCSSVVAMDSASWLYFSCTERFTSFSAIHKVHNVVSILYGSKICDWFLHSFVRFVFWFAGRSSETRCWMVNWSPPGKLVYVPCGFRNLGHTRNPTGSLWLTGLNERLWG